MDHHHIELGLAGVFQELAEDWAFPDGVGVGRATLFAVDLERSPALGLAVLEEEAFLSI
jgi:hypothetical protein